MLNDSFIRNIADLSDDVDKHQRLLKQQHDKIRKMRQSIIGASQQLLVLPGIQQALLERIEALEPDTNSDLDILDLHVNKELHSIHKFTAAVGIIDVLATDLFKALKQKLSEVLMQAKIATNSSELSGLCQWADEFVVQKSIFREVVEFHTEMKGHKSYFLNQLEWLKSLESKAAAVENSPDLVKLYEWLGARKKLLVDVINAENDIRQTYDDLSWPGSAAIASQTDIIETAAHLSKLDKQNLLSKSLINQCVSQSWNKYQKLKSLIDKNVLPWLGLLRFRRGFFSFLFRSLANICVIALNGIITAFGPVILLARHFMIVHACGKKLRLN